MSTSLNFVVTRCLQFSPRKVPSLVFSLWRSFSGDLTKAEIFYRNVNHYSIHYFSRFIHPSTFIFIITSVKSSYIHFLSLSILYRTPLRWMFWSRYYVHHTVLRIVNGSRPRLKMWFWRTIFLSQTSSNRNWEKLLSF